ncbi:large T antigen [Caerostris darwini]|uniref:Large T antigen n=1 Tax=Caerostris darwini TaxID=1538125 RepID=A0AAV4UZW7_9ARAC|nr:large T antigen [Caerostris darwini]
MPPPSSQVETTGECDENDVTMTEFSPQSPQISLPETNAEASTNVQNLIPASPSKLVDLKILVRRRKLLWHPDKNNPNEYPAMLIEAWNFFIKSIKERDSVASSFNDETFDFNSYTEAEPDLFCLESQPDLFCSETTLPPSPGPSNVSDPEPDLDDPLWGKWERRQRINKEYQQQEEGKKRTETPEYNDSPFDDDFFAPSPKNKFALPDNMHDYFRSATNHRADSLGGSNALRRRRNYRAVERISVRAFQNAAGFHR